MDPAVHADDLYEASHASEEGRAIWTYLPDGPWPDRASYTSHVRANAGMLDRLYYALRPLPGGKASGQASFMDIHAGNGVIEIGYIWFAPSMQHTRAATEALYLMLDHAMTDLRYPPHAVALQCAQRAFPRRRTQAGVPLRRDLPQPHGLQGAQPRHGVVFDPRRWSGRTYAPSFDAGWTTTTSMPGGVAKRSLAAMMDTRSG